MKKFYITLVTFLFLAVANAQIVNIPDANFKAILLAASPNNNIASNQTPVDDFDTISWAVSSYNTIDTNFDGEIQVSEANLIKYLNLDNQVIANLDGINNFTNLQWFSCRSNQLTSINIVDLTNLKYLSCSDNLIISLNLSGLTNLKRLDCWYNQLISLDISSFTNLKVLDCYNNQLTSLNVSGLINLLYLDCSSNQLPSLNVSGLTNLNWFYCDNNHLTSLNVSSLANLQYLYCENNQLSILDLSGTNLEYLYCNNNQLTSLNVSDFPNLTNLYCENNHLESLFIKNGNILSGPLYYFGGNPNLAYICADEEDLPFIQYKLNLYGYTNCTVDSNCNLSVDTNLYDDNYFTIYPNPVDELLNLTTKQATEVYSLTIYNLLGQQVQTTTSPTNPVDVSSLKTGNYIVKVVTDKGVSSSKFVKE